MLGVFCYFIWKCRRNCKCDSNCIGSSFDILLFLRVWLFSGTLHLCPLAGSIQSWQHCSDWLGWVLSTPGLQSLWANLPGVSETQGKFCQEVGNVLIPAVPVTALSETNPSVLLGCGSHCSWSRVGRGCHGTAFLAGSKSHGWQVGKDPAVDHSTEMALREQSCTGQRHPQPCSEHILSQTFNLHCLSVKKKANFPSLLHSHEQMSALGDWIWF